MKERKVPQSVHEQAFSDRLISYSGKKIVVSREKQLLAFCPKQLFFRRFQAHFCSSTIKLSNHSFTSSTNVSCKICYVFYYLGNIHKKKVHAKFKLENFSTNELTVQWQIVWLTFTKKSLSYLHSLTSINRKWPRNGSR